MWQDSNSTANVYQVFSERGGRISECQWSDVSPQQLGLSNEEHCSLSYTRETAASDAFSLWCPVSSEPCSREHDEAYIRELKSEMHTKRNVDMLQRLWEKNSRAGDEAVPWETIYKLRQVRLLPQLSVDLESTPFCGPLEYEEGLFARNAHSGVELAQDSPGMMPRLQWQVGYFSWSYLHTGQSYARAAQLSLSTLRARYTGLLLVGDSTVRQIAQHLTTLTGMSFSPNNCQGFEMNCAGKWGTLAVDYSFGHLSVNPKGFPMSSFYGERSLLHIIEKMDSTSVLVASIGHHFLLAPWRRFELWMDGVVSALEAKRQRNELGPVVWRLCNFRTSMEDAKNMDAQGMALATNNVRIAKLNEYVRTRLPSWVRIIDWGTMTAVGVLSSDLELVGYNHPKESSWMSLQLALMFSGLG